MPAFHDGRKRGKSSGPYANETFLGGVVAGLGGHMIDNDRASLDLSLAAFERRLMGAGGPVELARANRTPFFVTGPRSLSDIYARARLMGEKPLFAHGRDHRAYKGIFEPAFALAAGLANQGWGGRRIALALDDGAEWLVWFVAITAAGSACVLPPPEGADDRAWSRCESAGCDAVVAPSEHPLAHRGLKNLKDEIRFASETGPIPQVAPDAEAIVAFTSGSSGSPKGVIHTHRSLVAGLRNMMLGGALANRMLPASPGVPERPQPPSTLLLSSLAYVAGYSAFLLCVATGGRIVLPEDDGDDGDDGAHRLFCQNKSEFSGLPAQRGASENMKPQKSFTLFKRLFSEHLVKYKYSLIFAFACVVAVAVASSTQTYLMGPLIDKVFIARDSSLLWLIAAGILAIFALRSLARFLQEILLVEVGQKIVATIQGQLAGKLLRDDIAAVQSQPATVLRYPGLQQPSVDYLSRTGLYFPTCA